MVLDVVFYDLLGLNVKLPDATLSRKILDDDMVPFMMNPNRHLHTCCKIMIPSSSEKETVDPIENKS